MTVTDNLQSTPAIHDLPAARRGNGIYVARIDPGPQREVPGAGTTRCSG